MIKTNLIKPDCFGKRGLGKRGIADTQFHWLFVILAGGFIFFFFILFINQGIVANQNKQTAIMLQYFDGILSSSQNVQNLDDPVESTPSLAIQQSCEIGGQSKLTFVGQDLDKRTTFLPIFSQRSVSGAAYAIKTLPYDAPFHIDNPVYLTDTSTLYIVYDINPDVRDKYVELLPAYANVVSTELLSTVTESGFRDVVIITENLGSLSTIISGAGATDSIPSDLLDAYVRQVDVWPEDKRIDYNYMADATGDVIFVPRSDGLITGDSSVSDSAEYSDDSLLLGAVMSEDADLYLCNKEKLVARARSIAMQIYTRAGELEALSTISGLCRASYSSARDIIQSGLFGDITSDSIQRELVSENNQLILNSCPNLY